MAEATRADIIGTLQSVIHGFTQHKRLKPEQRTWRARAVQTKMIALGAPTLEAMADNPTKIAELMAWIMEEDSEFIATTLGRVMGETATKFGKMMDEAKRMGEEAAPGNEIEPKLMRLTKLPPLTAGQMRRFLETVNDDAQVIFEDPDGELHLVTDYKSTAGMELGIVGDAILKDKPLKRAPLTPLVMFRSM